MEDQYIVYVKKNGKWKKNSDHTNFEHAEINAKVQFQIGIETKIEKNGMVIRIYKRKGA